MKKRPSQVFYVQMIFKIIIKKKKKKMCSFYRLSLGFMRINRNDLKHHQVFWKNEKLFIALKVTYLHAIFLNRRIIPNPSPMTSFEKCSVSAVAIASFLK